METVLMVYRNRHVPCIDLTHQYRFTAGLGRPISEVLSRGDLNPATHATPAELQALSRFTTPSLVHVDVPMAPTAAENRKIRENALCETCTHLVNHGHC